MRPALRCLTLLTLVLAAPARAQEPVWDPDRRVMVVNLLLDSVDAYAAVIAAFQAEGLALDPPDTVGGRIISTPRGSDSYGIQRATVQYIAMVHRLPGGGTEVWLGGLLFIRQTSGREAGASSRRPLNYAIRPRPEGDVFFVTPTGGSLEWQRLEHIADRLSRVLD